MIRILILKFTHFRVFRWSVIKISKNVGSYRHLLKPKLLPRRWTIFVSSKNSPRKPLSHKSTENTPDTKMKNILDPTGTYRRPASTRGSSTRRSIACRRLLLDPTGQYWRNRAERANGSPVPLFHQNCLHLNYKEKHTNSHIVSLSVSPCCEELKMHCNMLRSSAKARWVQVRGREETSSCRRRRKPPKTPTKKRIHLNLTQY